MTGEREARLAEVLAAHDEEWCGPGGQFSCDCGQALGRDDEGFEARKRIHVAQAIAADERNVAAAAVEWPADDDHSWRAVAKRWECLYREAVGIPASEHQQRRLEQMADAVEEARARADRLTATGDQP